MSSHVVITHAQPMNYREDYVALPENYGTSEYFNRPDVIQIKKAVYDNLNELDAKIGFTKDLHNYKRVLIKPNLVSVYHHSGFDGIDYPESTDPRVLDAVISYIAEFTDRIAIIESSGKPMPTEVSFKVSGIKRVAKYRNTEIYPLENEPVSRFILPKAEVMKEVYLPTLLTEVIRGESFYISVPKLKTNLYTMVTLGFKNAMGTIPYFLRERNHNYLINKKLADLLYLFKPNLVVIDGIIGGEGNTPAPVDPVDVGVIISGNNTVAVDKVGTKMMGIDPDQVPLIMEAVKRGFDDPRAEIHGNITPVHFRRANPSLMDDEFCNTFPNILALAGHTLEHTPKVTNIHHVTPEIARRIEMSCDGGCLSALRSGFDYIAYSTNPNCNFSAVIIIGTGIEIDGKRYWFDRKGNPYSEQDIAKLPQLKLTLGNCAQGMNQYAKVKAPGCCDPAKCMLAACKIAGIPFPLLSFKNKTVAHLGYYLLKSVTTKCLHIIKGHAVDCPRAHVNKIYSIPPVEPEDQNKDYIDWPLPKMTIGDKWQAIKDQLSLLEI